MKARFTTITMEIINEVFIEFDNESLYWDMRKFINGNLVMLAIMNKE